MTLAINSQAEQHHLSFIAQYSNGAEAFLAINRLNPNSGFTCEHDYQTEAYLNSILSPGDDGTILVDADAEPHDGSELLCPEPAWCLLTIADAPELLNEPDTYRFCAKHAMPTVASFILAELHD